MSLLFAPPPGKPLARTAQVLSWCLVAILTAGLFSYAFAQLHYGWNWAAIWGYRQKFLQGWLMTVVISAVSLGASLLIGLVAALARRSPFLPLRYSAVLYVEAIRGTPLLVQILILFYVVANAFGLENRYLVGVLALSLFAGAYLAEMIRAGIEFTLNAQEVNAFTYSTLESYLPLAVGYLLLTLPISLLGRVLERRFCFAA